MNKLVPYLDVVYQNVYKSQTIKNKQVTNEIQKHLIWV